MRGLKLFAVVLLCFAATLSSCNTIDDERVPDVGVLINLGTPALWQTYGVNGYGDFRIFNKQLGEPRNFSYVANSGTGLGGVLLVSGFNPFTLEAAVPMAYDMACPVEVKSHIRVSIQTDGSLPIAVCPECGSSFNIVERAGSPIDGPALDKQFGLTRYECYQTAYGGYIIQSK